jgi:hypothetical protein
LSNEVVASTLAAIAQLAAPPSAALQVHSASPAAGVP